jgi:hypothetical protein
MAYTALQLITRAYYLSGIVAREFETISGPQSSDGLFLLNELLDIKSSDTRLIPYFRRTTLNLVQGTESYFVENLIQVEAITFNIGPVRYPMNNESRRQYFGTGRVDNIQSLPFEWHLERATGGSTLYFYFLPQQNFVVNISGKYALTDVTLFTDLTTVYDNFYIAYLRYALAQYICQEYDIDFPADKGAMLQKIEKKLTFVSPPDLTMKKANLITDSASINWAQANIGQGWTP